MRRLDTGKMWIRPGCDYGDKLKRGEEGLGKTRHNTVVLVKSTDTLLSPGILWVMILRLEENGFFSGYWEAE